MLTLTSEEINTRMDEVLQKAVRLMGWKDETY